MNKRIDVMTDIETLGIKSDSTIFQISACAFNIETGDILDTFNQIIDIETINNMKVDGSTIKWWLNTDRDLLHRLLTNKKALPFDSVLENFHNWIIFLTNDIKDVYLWGNGILFDNKMIQTQMELCGLDYPIYYKNDRDMRTIVELACRKLNVSLQDFKKQFADDTLTKHDAFDDVRWQIKVVSYCWNLLVLDLCEEYDKCFGLSQIIEMHDNEIDEK